MKPANFFLFIVVAGVLFVSDACKKAENKIELPYNYAGAIYVEYIKGFPAFSARSHIGANVTRDGTVTFDSGGNSSAFDAEDVKYEEGKPVLKLKMTGTLKLHDAAGEVKKTGDAYSILVRVHSTVNGQMMVWGWDDDMGWINLQEIPFSYEEKYGDGTLEFQLESASSLSGQDIKKTLPDIMGTFTYGYNLTLIPFP